MSHVLGCWQCFFVIFPFHIQLRGLSGGFWSGCHMKFIRGDRGKQLNVLMLFLSIVEICETVSVLHKVAKIVHWL